MVRVKSFEAVRPPRERAADVASLPYDVVTTKQARELTQGRPDAFLHVSRPEVDLPEGTDPHDAAVYETAVKNYRSLRDRGLLVRDAEPSIFLYQQTWRGRSQTGVVCCCSAEDYLANVIRKHEHTRKDKEDDRTRHMLALDANAGPVFLTYRDQAELDELVARDVDKAPIFEFDAGDGVTHRAWATSDPAAYVRLFAEVPFAYIADGHHRAASAIRTALERKDNNPHHDGSEEYNWFLAILFPASQLSILPYNRAVHDLNGLSEAEFIERLRQVGRVERVAADGASPAPKQAGTFGIFVGEHWLELSIDPSTVDSADPVASLDVALLQDRVLAPILGIEDPRVDRRIDFVGGIHGTAELERRVREGEAAVAFAVHETSIQQLLSVSDAELCMPPKSTWFEPKLRSGLFVHELDSPEDVRS